MQYLKELLESKAKWVRCETLKLHRRLPETRLASSLSCVEILCSLFYGGVIKFYPEDPYSDERDRFVISKGHGSISFYPILSDLGYFDKAELALIGKKDSLLKAIPDSLIPGYETMNGSVGHGLGVACGMALALKRKKAKRNVFVLSGDGELFEGSVWEAIMFAPQHKLNNLILIIDNNERCMLGYCRDIIKLEPLEDKFRVFGWTVETVDGHDVSSLHAALTHLTERHTESPKVLIANTVKGKGVKQLEEDPLCHIRSFKPDMIDKFLTELQ